MAISSTYLVEHLGKLLDHLKAGRVPCEGEDPCWCLGLVQKLIDQNTLPFGKVVNRRLCCPKGHHGALTWVEDTTLSREVGGFYPDTIGAGGNLNIEGHYQADDEGGEGHLFCSAEYQFRGKKRSCDTTFDLPPGVEIDFI